MDAASPITDGAVDTGHARQLLTSVASRLDDAMRSRRHFEEARRGHVDAARPLLRDAARAVEGLVDDVIVERLRSVHGGFRPTVLDVAVTRAAAAQARAAIDLIDWAGGPEAWRVRGGLDGIEGARRERSRLLGREILEFSGRHARTMQRPVPVVTPPGIERWADRAAAPMRVFETLAVDMFGGTSVPRDPLVNVPDHRILLERGTPWYVKLYVQQDMRDVQRHIRHTLAGTAG